MRRDGITSQHNTTPNSIKLTVSEEEAIKKYILKLDSREFAPPLNAFDLIRNVKAKYGIQNKDTYNFDESGFQMGIITQQKVITGSKRRH
ncbi:hypothetical protein K469DRAFT_713773 [Zopfia rhizophila CBS 207.26]|uniref:HTH CENPB-type domain-containing protein n=1 Tax=Zopfia rhizophila CBS 207.26 TaxID=1314779 RepID=A0A6A6DSH8_9PEZI|nr:hypothetical protein K469DRAFT_713773 [Zopfia rhizophila CBS 207.26]